MKQNSSSRKLNRQAQEIIASIVSTQIADPRLYMVTVTGCEVSTDRSLCRVYVSAAADSYDEVMEGLESAKGRIRSLFGRAIKWRVTPELDFRIDTTTDQAMRITEALKNVPPTLSVPKDEGGYPIVEGRSASGEVADVCEPVPDAGGDAGQEDREAPDDDER